MYTGRTGLQCVPSFIIQESAPIHLWRSSRNLLSRFPRWYKGTWRNQQTHPVAVRTPIPVEVHGFQRWKPVKHGVPHPRKRQAFPPRLAHPRCRRSQGSRRQAFKSPCRQFFRCGLWSGRGSVYFMCNTLCTHSQ